MTLPQREIERTVGVFPSHVMRRLLKKVLRLAKTRPDRHLSLREVLNRIGESGMTEANFSTNLSHMRKLMKIGEIQDEPELAVGITLDGWYPDLHWFEGPFPLNAEQAQAFGAKVGKLYRVDGRKGMWRLLATYEAMEQELTLITALTEGFATALEEGRAIREQHHRDILELIGLGFPKNPVHLPALGAADLERILDVPHYARLLAGIRLSETVDGFPKAEQHLKVTTGRGPVYALCPLRQLALGIAQRKQDGPNSLHHAVATLRSGLNVLNQHDLGEDNCTLCRVECSRSVLFIEHYRALGAAERKLHSLEQKADHLVAAHKCFTDGECFIDDKTLPAVKSDFYFSFGYLEFESAFRERPDPLSPQAGDQNSALKMAREKLEISIAAHKGWGAPWLRLGIIKLVLGEEGLGTDFTSAETFSSQASGADAALTKVLSMMCHRLLTECGASAAEHIYSEVLELFSDRLLPRGPRECHAFDAGVVFHYAKQRIRQTALRRAFELMIAAGTWGECNSSAEQQQKLQETLARIEKRSGAADA